MGAPIAVITGDLVGSTKGGPDAVDRSFAVIADVMAGADWLGAPPRLTRFRGDGWQVVVAPSALSLRLSLMVLARLRADETALPTRMAIGLGVIDRPGGADLSDADGSAFHRSGRMLEAMARRRRLALAPQDAPTGWSEIATLCDALASRWSVPQAEALALRLAPNSPSQTELAERLGISQQSLQERLDLAGFWALDEVLAQVEASPTVDTETGTDE